MVLNSFSKAVRTVVASSAFKGTRMMVRVVRTASGSSLYYSASNPEKNEGANRYLPDAKGYPYTVTRYTPDGSGRIMKQGGVGDITRMGSGKETKYYYGTSAQEELDGLFGTEAGYFHHYFKNMVQDANGQMSVSYVDMHGRTVATALAGEHPANLKDLYPGATYPTLTRNLLNNGSNLVKNNQNIESVNTILVPASTSYTFSYTLSPDKLQVAPPGCSTNICYDCLYNLEIAITDESGENAPIVRKFDNLSVASPYDCNSVPFLKAASSNTALSNLSSGQITFNEVLPAGSYSVRKTLTISEASIQSYKDDYLSKACWKTPEQLADSVYLELLKVTKCDQPVVPVAPADTSQVLATKRALMLSDMIPFSGQYAIDPSSEQNATPQAQGIYNTGTMYNKYNIFSTANTSAYFQPFYKYPKTENGTPTAGYGSYYDNYGQPDQSIYPDPYLLPSLQPVAFESLFKDKWAESLLPYHPEYKKLLYAEQNLRESYNMISKFSQVNSYDEAAAAGYLFTSEADLTNADPLKGDPFYKIADVQSSTSYKSTMVSYITSAYKEVQPGISVSMWQMARMYIKCKDKGTKDEISLCALSAPRVPPFSDITTTEDKNQLWQAFRSLYQSERDDQVNQYLQLKVPNTDAGDLISANYILHFPESNKQMAKQLNNQGGNWNWYPANAGDPPAASPATPVADAYTSQCHSYIGMWKQSLLQCPALDSLSNKDAVINQITSRMELVCRNGSDPANPNGSSTVSPNTPASVSDRSFEDIIKSVFADNHIAITDYCNPYVIEFPKPYGKNPKFYNEVTATIDTCNCNQFALFRDAAGSDGSTLTNFNTYLRQQGLDTLTQVLYDALSLNCDKTTQVNCTTTYTTISYDCTEPNPCNIKTIQTSTNASSPGSTGTGQCYVDCPSNTCETTYNPFPLPSPQPLPDFLKCGFTSNKTCYSCAELSSLTVEFKNTFPSPYNAAPVLTGTNINADQVESNKSFARFINFRTGFQYSWVDYAKKAAAASPACDFAAYNSNGSAMQNVVCADTHPLTDTAGIFVTQDPCQGTHNMAIAIAGQLFAIRQEAVLADFEAQYRGKCLSLVNNEQFTVTYANKEYHYTLYYYDQAGNLVKTVPPKGVITNYAADYLAAVKSKRDAGGDVLTPYSASLTDNSNPSPALSSSYCYNSLNQVVQQKTPDGGISAFWYDKLGRLVVSQNAQQNIDGKYSYTLYDPLGRITEVGQKPQTTQMTQDISQGITSSPTLDDWINSGGTREQLTVTSYDLPFIPMAGIGFITQQNLRNRVSYTATKSLSTDNDFTAATYYTYDVHGNVDVLLQDYNGIASMKVAATDSKDNRYKKITYDYDLISGKVNQVNYQDGYSDAFYHRYNYDAENRITGVETSHDEIVWEKDAAYEYYKHGPLSRTTLGQLNVQGADYAYTLQGWLKGVNSTTISATGSSGSGPCATGTAYDVLSVSDRFQFGQPSLYIARNEVDFMDGFESVNNDFDVVIDPGATACIPASVTPFLPGDMGQDGSATGNSGVARDAYGFSLNYHNGDYSPVNASVAPFATGLHNLPGAPSDGVGAAQELFNGNIASMMVSIPKLSPTTGGNGTDQMVYGYQYDQLNRMVNMNAYRGTGNPDNTFTPIAIDDYKERAAYDPNGNIMSYTRNGTKTTTRTSVAMDALAYYYLPNTNKLSSVSDAVNDASSGNMEDIKNQGANNYTYDAIGNMTGDAASGITNISWTVYGKIASITKAGGTISYTYDAVGNRISKTVGSKTTVYVRDATGNVMSVYEAIGTDLPVQTEINVYGSSRLGIIRPHAEPTPANSVGSDYGTAKLTTFTRGEKFFELSNHLGNILSTVSDKRLQISSNGTSLAYYAPDVITATDYAPFGMPLVGRNVNSDTYRYGFNGKENDNEVKGEGNSIDFGERIYDPRVGRFLSVDPLQKKYPDLSPYHFSGNNPILFVDYDGKDFGVKIDHNAKTIVVVANVYTTSKTAYEQALKSASDWNAKSAKVDGYLVTFQVKVMEASKSPMTDEEIVKSNPSMVSKRGKVDEGKLSSVRNKILDNAAWAEASSDDIGNVYAGNKGYNSKSVSGDTYVGGATANKKHISMNTHDVLGDMGEYQDLVTHEIGHELGLDDEGGTYFSGDGIMKYKGTSLNPISDNDVKNILKLSKEALGGKAKETDAKVKLIEQKGKSDGSNPIGIKSE